LEKVWHFSPETKGHACLFGSAVSLLQVTGKATGNQITPGIISSPRLWNDVIYRQLFFRSAVGAFVAVALVNAASIYPKGPDFGTDVVKKPDDERLVIAHAFTTDDVLCVFYDFCLSL